VSIFNPRADAKSRIRFSELFADPAHAVAVAALVVLTFAAFYPALHNGFLDYDDDSLYLNNPYFRGLGWLNIRWAFTTFLMGHYQPLTWLSVGFDYVVWGMNPFGYHLTNLLLHAVNTVLFYFLAVRLLSFVVPPGKDSGIAVGAAVAAALFSIHPLRVESVVWITERRDVLSGMFVLLTVHAYVTAAQAENRSSRGAWLALTLVAYVLSLLSKAVGMTLPVVFLILDVYPLGRLGGSRARWIGPEVRGVWLEKIPFVIFGAAAAIVAAMAQRDTYAMKTFTEYGIGPRVAQAFYGFVFYVWKTLVPTNLLPMYVLPAALSPSQRIYLTCALIVIAATAALIFFRKTWPAGLAVWLCYLAVVLPVSGIAQSGPQIVALRYTYLSCLGFALLAGGGVVYFWRRWGAVTPAAVAGAVSLALVGAVFIYVTRQQIAIWRDTEGLWRYVLSIEPNSTVAHNDLGNILFKRGEVDAAIGHYRQAIRLSPQSGLNHYNLANALARQGKIDEAIDEYRRAVFYAPYQGRAWYSLALLLGGKGETDEAVEDYGRAIKAEPNYPKSYNNLGELLLARGRPEEAARLFRQAIARDPKFAAAYANLGRAFVFQRRPDDARQAVDSALAMDPDLALAHYAKATLLMQQQRFDEAIGEYRKAIAGSADYKPTLYRIGAAYFELGRFNEAAAAYRELLEAYPSRADARYSLGNTLLKLGKPAAAAEQYRAAIKLEPRYTAAHTNLGSVLDMTGDDKAAMAEYRRAIEIDPRYAAARFNLANSLWKTGELDKAIAEYRRAIEIDPRYVEAHTNLAMALDAAGRDEDAAKEFREALKIDPQYTPAEFNFAVFLGERGDADAAVERLRHVIRLTPRDAEAHLHLGRYLFARGERAAAARELREALRIQPDLAAAKEALKEFSADAETSP
jgi:tetratricopeptide (TPR) repeat protein